jgi:hypothetical protein
MTDEHYARLILAAATVGLDVLQQENVDQQTCYTFRTAHGLHLATCKGIGAAWQFLHTYADRDTRRDE